MTSNSAGSRHVLQSRSLCFRTLFAIALLAALAAQASVPTIGDSPHGLSVTSGQSATFHVSASGSSLSYQWRFNGQPITDALSSTLMLARVSIFDAGDYDVVVSNSSGNATSDVASLTVAPTSYPTTLAVDPSFAPAIETTGGSILSMVRQPDGKLLVGGSFVRISGVVRHNLARLNADGSVDPSFDSGAGPSSTVRTIALLPDGKAIVAGDFAAYGTVTCNRIIRIGSDGEPDPTFSAGSGANSTIYDVCVDAAGKIIVSGGFSQFNGINHSTLVRLTADGALDPNFDPSGSTVSWPSPILVQSDGKILFRTSGGLVRLNSDGSRDQTFTTAPETNFWVTALALQPDGQVLVGGDNGAGSLVRVGSNGILDSAFAPVTESGAAVAALAVGSDGKILVGYSFSSGGSTERTTVARLNSDGSPDETFIPPADPNGSAACLVAGPAGQVILGKTVSGVSPPAVGVMQLRNDGSRDPAFADVDVRLAGQVYTMLRQPDGKLLIGGVFNFVNDIRCDDVARLNSDASFDSGFNASITGGAGRVNALGLQPDGKILVAGYFTTVDGESRSNLARLGSDGSLDSGFAVPAGSPDGEISAVALQPDEKILIAGEFSHYGNDVRWGLARINPDGTIDPTFDTVSQYSVLTWSILPLHDGHILCAGWNQMALNRFNSDGSPDDTFHSGGNSVDAVLVAPDGKLYAAGAEMGAFRQRLVRLFADGTQDFNYSYNDVVISQIGGIPGTLYLQPDGRLIAGRIYNSSGNGTPPMGIARLRTDGTQDTSFSVTGLLDAGFSRIYMTDDGSLLVSGNTFFDGHRAQTGVARFVAPAAPAITSANSAAFLVGESDAFSVTASGAPAATYQLLSGTLPAWLVFNATTGEFSGTPPDTAAPSYGFVIAAANGIGAAARQSFTLTIKARPTVLAAPAGQLAQLGQPLTLQISADGRPAPTYQWLKDGVEILGATSSSFSVPDFQISDAGAYSVVLTNDSGSTESAVAIVGVASDQKVIGAGVEFAADIVHPNGNIFDQVLLNGRAATVTADPGQITRTSFVDLSDDIVQIEFSGAGTLTIILDDPSSPALPANYNQQVLYMKGHAHIVIAGANETTNVSVFSIGRATAFDPTGGFNFLQPISATNNPANNGSSLFVGHADTVYDGFADAAVIMIQSTDGRFGGLRAANGSFFAASGYTGIVAPGVAFAGPVFVHDIAASDSATPALLLGAASDVRITGGSLLQPNNDPVQVQGFSQLRFVDGSSSHGVIQPAQADAARLVEDGVDVTDSVVVNPNP